MHGDEINLMCSEIRTWIGRVFCSNTFEIHTETLHTLQGQQVLLSLSLFPRYYCQTATSNELLNESSQH